MGESCAARNDSYITAHTCDDVLACALNHLGPIEETEAEHLAEVIERARALVGAAPTERVCMAVANSGSRPDVHAAQVRRLAKEWPTLANALGELLRVRGYRTPREWQGGHR